jgi:hypothetical protein
MLYNGSIIIEKINGGSGLRLLIVKYRLQYTLFAVFWKCGVRGKSECEI